MTKIRPLMAIMSLVVTSCSCCNGVLVMFAPDAPKRSFQIADLLIDETALPAGKWEITDRDDESPCVEGPGEEVWVDMYPKGVTTNSLRIVEAICRYDKTWRASLQYDSLENSYIFPSSFGYWDVPPVDISFSSKYADKWRLACQDYDQTAYWYHCRYFALYHEYLLEFDVWNGTQPASDNLTFDEITSILQLIDEKMASHLGEK
jgi:hypothetical protein